MTTPGGATYAAKCFLSEAEDQQARYRAIASHLGEADLPYTVGFDYQPGGIQVGGETFPLLKMDWAGGVPLNRFVREHLDTPGVLVALAEAWAEMLAALDEAAFAHGDLQHGNVLVEKGDGLGLRLVDYDTAYVPALAGKTSAEVGHRNYQHPDRTEDDFGPYLDRFPGLAVHVALRALAVQPALWETHDTGENLLFRAADFYNPTASPLFAKLEHLDAIRREVQALRTACHRAPEDVPTLRDVRSGAVQFAAAPLPRPPRSPRASPRRGLARWFAPALAAHLLLIAALTVAGHGIAALIALLLGIAGTAALATHGYRQQSVVRRRRRLRQERARLAERIETMRREQQALQEQRKALQSHRDERRSERLDELRDEALRDRLKHHFIGEVRAVEGLSHKTVVRLKAAGIRTAHECTPQALAGVTKLGEKSKARLRTWRTALAERYADDLPETLSPAQQRRLERRAERRLEQIDEEAARVRRKIETQAAERADVEARAETLPPLSRWGYLCYLLRLRPSLPSPTDASSPAPSVTAPTEASAATDTQERPPARQEDEQRAWYEQ